MIPSRLKMSLGAIALVLSVQAALAASAAATAPCAPCSTCQVCVEQGQAGWGSLMLGTIKAYDMQVFATTTWDQPLAMRSQPCTHTATP